MHSKQAKQYKWINQNDPTNHVLKLDVGLSHNFPKTFPDLLTHENHGLPLMIHNVSTK